MKKQILFICLLLPVLSFSQTKDKALNEYYSSLNLIIDSAKTPYLYYQVYNWVGAKYKYSGDSKKGIDCSGFASEMYKNVYCIHLDGGSRDIYKCVEPVSKKDLKEGDLVFFKIRKGKISHVGVYLANNKFAHATTKVGVTISDLNEDYYKRYFFNGGRIIKE
jgi:lipoprotein Spr